MVFLSHPSTVETIVSFFFHADIAIHMTNLEYEISSIDSAYFVKQTALFYCLFHFRRCIGEIFWALHMQADKYPVNVMAFQ